MIAKGLFTQLVILVISVGVIFTYTEPTFSKIGEVQDQISIYREERGKVELVNQTLQQKLATINSVSEEDLMRLRTYMPNQVDPLLVMRDLQFIGETSGLTIRDIEDDGPVQPQKSTSRFAATNDTASAAAGPHPYAFTLSVEGSYNSLKTLLDLLENNHYPLEVRSLNVTSNEGGFLSATLIVYTYSHEEPIEEAKTIFEDVNVTYE